MNEPRLTRVAGRLHLSPEALAAMKAHAESDYPHECCGLLVGRQDGDTRDVVKAPPARNLNEDRAHDRFELDPEDFLRIDRDARASSLEVVGCYHSHPDHPPRPSRFDAERAFSGFSYIILSVRAGRLSSLRSWRFDEQFNRYDEEEVITD